MYSMYIFTFHLECNILEFLFTVWHMFREELICCFTCKKMAYIFVTIKVGNSESQLLLLRRPSIIECRVKHLIPGNNRWCTRIVFH